MYGIGAKSFPLDEFDDESLSEQIKMMVHNIKAFRSRADGLHYLLRQCKVPSSYDIHIGNAFLKCVELLHYVSSSEELIAEMSRNFENFERRLVEISAAVDRNQNLKQEKQEC